MATIEIPKAIQKALSDVLKAAHQAGREEARAEMAASLTGAKAKPRKPRKPRADAGRPRADAGRPRGPRKPKAEAQINIPWDGKGARPNSANAAAKRLAEKAAEGD